MRAKIVGDRSGVTRQEFTVGPAIHPMVSLLNDLFGGQVLLLGSSGATDAEQAGDVRDFEAGLTM